MTLPLCDPGWHVHKSTVQNKWDDNTHTHTHTHTQDSNGPASMVERESRARSETAGDGTASGGKVGLGDSPSRQLGQFQRGPGYESRRVFLFRPDLR